MQDEGEEERTGLDKETEMRLLEAKAYMSTEAYKQHSLDRSLDQLTRLGLSEAAPPKDMRLSKKLELEVASENLRKKREKSDKLNINRHALYMNQLTRKPRTFEDVKEEVCSCSSP